DLLLRFARQYGYNQLSYGDHVYRETSDPLTANHIFNSNFYLTRLQNVPPVATTPVTSDPNWPYIEEMLRREYTKGLVDPDNNSPKVVANGGANLHTIITVNNLREYYSGTFANIFPLKSNPSSDAYLQIIDLTTPFGAAGRNGTLDLGRVPIRGTPLTLWKP